MKEKKTNNSLVMCILSCFITFGCYGLERILVGAGIEDKTVSLMLAFVFTALTGLLYFLISKIKDPFYGVISAIFAFKLATPEITNLIGHSFEGEAVYSIVQMASTLLFATLIIKHFRLQKSTDKPFEVLPIIALLFTVMLISKASNSLYISLYFLGGTSLYGPYVAQAILYFWAILIIYIVTIRSNLQTVKLIATYQVASMSFNILRRFGTMVTCLVSGSHISNSYYCWIAIYFVVLIAFAVMPRIYSKKQAE